MLDSALVCCWEKNKNIILKAQYEFKYYLYKYDSVYITVLNVFIKHSCKVLMSISQQSKKYV